MPITVRGNVSAYNVTLNGNGAKVVGKTICSLIDKAVINLAQYPKIEVNNFFDTSENWINYAAGIRYTDLTQRNSGGRVLVGEYKGETIYRFISDAKTGLYPSSDSFYRSFDNGVLINLIVTR
mgnify:CR=1 FL=1